MMVARAMGSARSHDGIIGELSCDNQALLDKFKQDDKADFGALNIEILLLRVVSYSFGGASVVLDEKVSNSRCQWNRTCQLPWLQL